jgi:fermentation-respiration switch protein FrsA (DUF1100 family)
MTVFFFRIGFFVLAIIGFSGCSSLMYYPTKNLKFYDPQAFKLQEEDVDFKDQDGHELHGWWFKAQTENAKGTFVFFHGNAENLTSHFAALSWLPAAGYNFFIFDYPGYGLSSGEPGPRENVVAGEAAIRWVHQNKDQRPLIIYGQSMGGIVALRSIQELRREVPIQVVIADGTFQSFQRIARKKLSHSWVTWLFQPLSYVLLSDSWAPDVRQISPTPLIVMHGRQDPVVEFELGQELFQRALEPKEFIEVEEGLHGNLFRVQEGRYQREILAKIEAL